jgi:hypothetical protein
MLLSELFDRLATGELSQHKFGKSGAILEDDRPAIINQVNMGLTALHTHFPLVEKEAQVLQQEGVLEYTLPDPTVIRIETAYNAEGVQVPLNQGMLDGSWFLPAWNVLRIPEPVEGEYATVIYRANHPKVDLDTVEVVIPPSLEEALQAYIAGRCFVSLGNQSSASLSAYYTTRYEQQIQRVERDNLVRSSNEDTNHKLTLKGFI